MQAIDVALRTFGAAEIVLSIHDEAHSNWLGRADIAKAEARFDVPITHVVVDLSAAA